MSADTTARHRLALVLVAVVAGMIGLPTPRCRSTGCSARPPASAARRSAPSRRRPTPIDAHRRRCASTPTSTPDLPWRFRAGAARGHGPARRGRRWSYFRASNLVETADRRHRRPSTSRPSKAGHYFNKIAVLLLHRADAAAGPERRHAGDASSSIPTMAERPDDTTTSRPSRCPTPSSAREDARGADAGCAAGSGTAELSERNRAWRAPDHEQTPTTCHEPKHPYHLVDPSPWPIVGAHRAAAAHRSARCMYMHLIKGVWPLVVLAGSA